MKKIYDLLLARVYNQYFGDLAINASKVVLDLLNSSSDTKLIITLGCGSGQFASELMANEHQVIGVDSSHHMIQLAHKNAPNTEFF